MTGPRGPLESPVYRRTLPFLAALLVLLAPVLAGFGPPRQGSGPLQLTLLEAGYGRRFREDRWVPLRVSVSNDGPDVRGSLRVRSETNAGLNATTYSTPLDLPRQSRKQVFLYVSMQSYARQVMVELIAETGEVLASASSQLVPAREGDLLAAVVTDAPGGSVDLTGIDLAGGSSYQANWSVENIPPLADALLGLDLMVITDVDTGRLSVQQQQAIADWVLAGGHLVVAGGPNYRLTTAGVADLLPLAVGGTTTVDDLTPLAAFAGRYADTLREPDVILAVGEVRPGAEVLVAVEGLPLLARRVYGEGLVDYLAADPSLAPFRRWRGSGALWEVLATTPRQIPSWSEGFQDWGMADRVAQQTPEFDLPSVLQLCAMLDVYILVIGPLNYLVLRVLRRRELAWLTIPVLVVVFSVVAYFTGFSLRGTQVTINRLALMQVWPGVDRAQVDALVCVLSPRRSTYNLTLAEGLTLRTLPEGAPGAGFNPVLSSTLIEESASYAARDVLVDASFAAAFAASGFIDDAPHVDGQATLIYSGGVGVRVAGSVTNTTGMTLSDAVVLIRGGFQHVGTLEPGDSAEFDLPYTSRQSAPLSLFNQGDPTFYFGNGLDLTAQDVLGRGYSADRYYYGRALTVPERQLRQRQDFVSAVAPDRDLSGGRGDRVFLLAWADHSPLDLTLEGAPWVTEDVTLFVFELPVTVEVQGEPVVITPGFSTWVTTGDSTAINASPYDLTLNSGEQAAFRFIPLPTAQLAQVTSLDITARRAGYYDARFHLWDWQAEEWVELALMAGIRATIEDPAPFIGPANAVQVLVVPDTLSGLVTYEQVDVTWTGVF